MGGQQSSQSDILPELQTMSMIKEDEFYSIYESKDDKQVEFWMFTSDESTYKTELQIIKDIQQQNFKGLTKILKYKVVEKEKLLIFTNKCICILTEHPKYTLQEYIKRYGNLDSKKIIELTIQIVGAQKILGSKQQYVGMDNIFTNDGAIFMIKPFLQTNSFYQTLQSKKIPLQDDDLLGFPAPEEFNFKVVDKGRVQIFGLGLILLQLILRKKSQDIYKNGKINFQMLDERILELQETNNVLYTKRFKEIIVSMIDTNLERRPNYNQLVDLLKNSDLAPQSKLPLNQVTVISDLSGAQDYFKKESAIGHRAIQIFESYSQFEKSIISQIEQQESRFYQKQSSIMKIQQLDGTKYQGELKNNVFQGEGKLFSKEDELIYQGEFYEGKYHGFGIQNFAKFQKIQGQYDYINLKDMFLYVTKFQGQFQSGIKQGIGKAFLSNGEIYCGDFVNDLPDGYGTFVNINKNIITAEWRKGEMKEKIGVLTSQINPQLINDKQDQQVKFQNIQNQNNPSVNQKPALQQFTGISKLESILSVFYQSSKQHKDFFLSQTMKQNSIKFENLGETIVCYEGEIVNQKMFGKGVLYFKNKKVQYEGQFLQGLFHGYGKLHNEFPSKENKIDISDMRDIFTKGWWISFEGEFQNGKKHGFGQLLLSDQSQFYGEFYDDQVHGEGRWRRDGKQDFQAIWECNIIKSIISGQQ